MDLVSEAMVALANCLCEEIKRSGLPEPCFCGVVPGDAADVSYAGGDCNERCGMAWVRLEVAYPAIGVGVINEQPGNCASTIGYEIEMGIVRCISHGTDDGEGPTDAELLEASVGQNADMMAMMRAVMCCNEVTSKDYIMGTYTPIGPQGGLTGGVWSMALVI